MILFLRLLDWSGSTWRRYWKIRRVTKKWKNTREWNGDWQTYARSGRSFRRVYQTEITKTWTDYPEPGWAWTCQNCKTFSLIRESDMPGILAEWQKKIDYMVNKGLSKNFPAMPTAATAPCTNCCYRPGDPE